MSNLLDVFGASWFYYTEQGGKIIRFSSSDYQLTISRLTSIWWLGSPVARSFGDLEH